jgi:hypothetical protein
MVEPDQFISKAKAAGLLGISESSLKRLIVAGELASIRVTPRRTVLSLRHVEGYQDRLRRQATREADKRAKYGAARR